MPKPVCASNYELDANGFWFDETSCSFLILNSDALDIKEGVNQWTSVKLNKRFGSHPFLQNKFSPVKNIFVKKKFNNEYCEWIAWPWQSGISII